jgi:hypothetical protein
MSQPPTTDQINAALKRARAAAKARSQYPNRLLAIPLPKHGSERLDDRWWLIGRIVAIGESERWDVLYDPETDKGRLRASHFK